MPAFLALLLLFCPLAPAPPSAAHFLVSDDAVKWAASFSAAHAEWACGPRQPLRAPWGPFFLGRVGGNVRDQRWRTEALYCEACWEALRVARTGANAATRSEKLAELRGLLGRTAFEAGMMPPLAPIWYFRVTD